MSASIFLFLMLQLVSAEPIPIRSSTNVATWFQPDFNGRSACPSFKDDTASAVALSSAPFANGTACHSLIKIESKGITAYGRVTDLCPEPYCRAGDLNLSPQLFSQFAPLSHGTFTGLQWSFANHTTSQPTNVLESFVPEEEPEPQLSTPVVPADQPTFATPTSWGAIPQAASDKKLLPPPPPIASTSNYPPFHHSSVVTTTSTSQKPRMTQKPEQNPFSGHITWYNPSVGTGACGAANTEQDYVIALNSAQYPGKCGKKITINGNGKQVSATVMDECPTCGYGDLDLSPAVFKNIAGLEVGMVPITWDFT